MGAQVHLLAGPAKSGKTARLLERYRQSLARAELGASLWLAPTQRSANEVRAQLLHGELRACFNPGVTTFAKFASAVVDASGQPVRPITPAMKQHLLRGLIESAIKAGRLKHFQPIAASSGFLALLGEWISELKRLEIWPDELRLACQRRGIAGPDERLPTWTPKDRELLELYEAYQHALTTHQLFDAEGRFWTARALLRAGQTEPFARLRVVVVDGFTDFTRTQHEILEILAERVDELHLSLPLEEPLRREELFRKSHKTLDALRKSHPTMRVVHAERPPHRDWPAMQTMERQLFLNPRQIEPCDDTQGVEMIAAGTQVGELEWIGRRIKELLIGGGPESGGQPVRPGDVAVVLRSPSELAPLIREVFGRLGLPFAMEAGQSLDASPAVAAVVALLHLHQEDWPFRRLLAVVGSNYFQPRWRLWNRGRAVGACERTIRTLQLPHGREKLLQRVDRQVNNPETDAATSGVHDESERKQLLRQRRNDARICRLILNRLDLALQRLPKTAPIAGWIEALEIVLNQTGFLRALDVGAETEDRPTVDRRAYGRLMQALAECASLARHLGESPQPIDLAQFLDLLLNLVRLEELPSGHSEIGNIRVLAAASARALAIPYLFFAGLSEKAMPLTGRDDHLYSEAENLQFVEAGLPLILRAERGQEEMLLFYEVVTRATRFLCLSYPALDEKAQPLLPSPFLTELRRALGNLEPRQFADLSPVARSSVPYSAADFRCQAVQQALLDQRGLLSSLVRQARPAGMAENLLAGLELTAQRAARDRFGPFEGILDSDAARETLARRFGRAHRFSASQLESYASCPFRFLLQQVLRIQPAGEIGLATDWSNRGWRLHALLSNLHRRLNELAGRHTSPQELPDPDFRPLYEQILCSLLELKDDEPSLHKALTEIDHRLLLQWMANYRQQHEQYDGHFASRDAALRPAHFEVSFGSELPKDRSEVDPLSSPLPLELKYGRQTIQLVGQIDRIDVGEWNSKTVFNVVDYKSAGKSISLAKRNTIDGTLLQLELYTMAAEQLLQARHAAAPLEGGYWYIRVKGFLSWIKASEFSGGKLAPTGDWTARKQAITEKVFALADGIRSAQFPVYSLDSDCTGRCPYHTVCRVNQVRSLEKTWPQGYTPTA